MVPAKLNYSRPAQGFRSSTGSPSHTDVYQGCAMVDPWCEQARGSKIPDDDSTPSVALSQKFQATVNSDASGRAGAVFKPNPTSNTVYGAATLNGSSILTWGAGFTDPSAATISAAAGEYRIVSWGVRCYSSLAPTNQSGTLRFITAGTDVSTGAAFTVTGSFFERVEDYPVANCDVHWVSRPVGTGWKEYTSIGTNAYYEQLVVYATGLPASATACLQFEIVFNLELQAKPNDLAAALATAALVSRPHVLQAASLVHANRKSHHNGSTSSFGERMKRMMISGLQTVAKVAFPYASAFLGNSVSRGMNALMGGQQTPLIMDVD